MTEADRQQQESAGLEPLLSVDEVGRLLQISESGVYRLIRAGDIVTGKIGGRTRFEPAAVRAYIAAQRQVAATNGEAAA